MNTHDKYWFCKRHPEFINDDFIEVDILIDPHMVCPSTHRIEDYKPLNTKIQYWVEFCPPWFDENTNKWVRSHDMECDTGGWTYEEAIDNLYDLVLAKYGDYTEEDVDNKEEEIFQFSKSTTTPLNWGVISGYPSKHERPWSSNVMDGITKQFMPEDVVKLEKYREALTEYRKTAKVDELHEIDSRLNGIEHDLYTHHMSLKTGLDFT